MPSIIHIKIFLFEHIFLFQDHLIPKSAWKEFSANTNYAFEAFETKDKQPSDNRKKHNHQDIKGRSEQNTPATINSRQIPQNRPQNVPYLQPGYYPGDMRSLQRPKDNLAANIQRTTFSLPRSAYNKNQRGGAPELQPDFYFMPSQRKYSGEVVRVYVDYNNENKSTKD